MTTGTRRNFLRSAGEWLRMGTATLAFGKCRKQTASRSDGDSSSMRLTEWSRRAGEPADGGDRPYVPGYVRLHEQGELRRRASKLWKLMERCTLCPRACGTRRLEGGTGVCRASSRLRIASHQPRHSGIPVAGECRPLRHEVWGTPKAFTVRSHSRSSAKNAPTS